MSGGDPRSRWAERLVAASVAHPRRVVALAAVALALSLAAAIFGLEIHTSNLDLIDPDLPEVQRFLRFSEDFGHPNPLVAVIESEDPERIAEAADFLAPRLRALPEVATVIDRLPHPPEALEILGIDPYLRSDDGRLCAIFVQPRNLSSSVEAVAPFVQAVRGVLAELPPELGVRAGVTGIPAYALDDRDVIQRDVSRWSAVGAGAVLLLFALAFADLRRPLAALVALVPAVAAVLGTAAFFPGRLTLLSAFFGSILFGLGIDFAVHLIDRVEASAGDGLTLEEALPRAAADLAAPLSTAAVTSASAFFAMMLSGFRGFEELGFLAGAGLLLAFLTTLTVLPALLVLLPRPSRQRLLPGRPLPGRPRRNRIGRTLAALQSPTAAVALALAVMIAGLFAWSSGRPRFDTDYLALQPEGSETVHWERRLVAESPWSPQFAAFTVGSREELSDLLWTLADDETVDAVRSLRDFEMPGLPGALPELPQGLLDTLRSADGRLAVYAYPAGDVWNRDVQDAFLAHMRAIDPEVTGMPFLGRLMIDRSRRALVVTGAVGSLLLLLWVAWDFRDPGWALLAVLPAFGTLVATAGIMAWAGMDFHPLNVMALPVILGIAVDDGIHVVHRFRDRLRAGIAGRELVSSVLEGTGRGVVLTSLTNLGAFGALVLTDHRGLASFAGVLCIGVTVALVLSIGVLPQGLRAWAALGPRIYGRRQRKPTDGMARPQVSGSEITSTVPSARSSKSMS